MSDTKTNGVKLQATITPSTASLLDAFAQQGLLGNSPAAVATYILTKWSEEYVMNETTKREIHARFEANKANANLGGSSSNSEAT